jgi:hypothetical protein
LLRILPIWHRRADNSKKAMARRAVGDGGIDNARTRIRHGI